METYAENQSFYALPVIISMASIENFQFWLSRFINEILRKDGTNYPPNTLTNIAARIQRKLTDQLKKSRAPEVWMSFVLLYLAAGLYPYRKIRVVQFLPFQKLENYGARKMR